MGNKDTNAQASIASPGAMSGGISQAFGDDGPEEEARKRQQAEDAAQAQAAGKVNGSTPSAWDTMTSMGADAMSGMKDIANNPSSAWNSIMNPDPMKKKKN